MIHINFQKIEQADGSYTVVVTFTGLPDEQQADLASLLIKRALMDQGAAGVIGDTETLEGVQRFFRRFQ
jgi:hypothetical protein